MLDKITYTAFPDVKKWKKDSSVKSLGIQRKSDPVLKRIDRLIESLVVNSDDDKVAYYMCERHFATDFWLRNYSRTSYMNAGREPAIRGLSELTGKNYGGLTEDKGGSLKKNWSYFVMNWQRQIYVAPHSPKSKITPNYHNK
jgi:hypothetical protein